LPHERSECQIRRVKKDTLLTSCIQNFLGARKFRKQFFRHSKFENFLLWTRRPLKRSFYPRFKLAYSCQKKSQFTYELVKKTTNKIMNEKFYNCVKKWHATALFLTQNACKMNRYGTFLTLLDRFKNHIQVSQNEPA
jgi:hypothetical protein